MITQSELQEILHYDPETGIFTRRVASANNKMKAGQVAGGLSDKGYILIRVRSRRYAAHRLAWLYIHGSFPPDGTDHINGVRDDNRLCNLRPATKSQNGMNQGKQRSNTSGFKGVYWSSQHQKWRAQCVANGKKYYLGLFDAAEDASAAYSASAIKHHGQFFNDGTTRLRSAISVRPTMLGAV